MSHAPKAADPGRDAPSATLGTPPGEKTWTVGSLVYTKQGLFLIFLWMIWGDMVFILVEHLFPQSMPLQLERLHFNKIQIMLLITTLSQFVHIPMTPYLSMKSDRLRTRWGRRIPFIFFGLFPLSICLAALGFSDEIGAYVNSAPWLAGLWISPKTILFIVMAVLIVLFDFSNVFINTIYYYLFADVIPRPVIARFNAAIRMTTMATGSLFAFFLRRHIEIHTKYIYLGAAALCLVGFSIMCWKIKEGTYPPPKPLDAEGTWYARRARAVKLYFKETFRHPLFVSFYVADTTLQMSNACMLYTIFYYREYLHLSQQQMGNFQGLWVWINISLAMPLGWLAEKLHPMRTTLIALACVVPLSFYGLYMESYLMYMLWFIVRAPFMQLLDASARPLAISLFPRKQYGQFASASATVKLCTMLLCNLAGAWFIHFLDDRGMGRSGCRFLFLWLSIFQGVAFGCTFITYLYWKAHGAEKFVYDPDHPTSTKLIEPVDDGTPVDTTAPVAADSSEPALAVVSPNPAPKK